MLAQVERAFAARATSEARMRRFVTDVSHELRTPLFGIRGSTELYRMGALSKQADVDQTMRRIESESSRLASLTEDLLLLARLDEGAGPGALRLQLAPMDLRTLAADALHDLRALDPTRTVELTGPGTGPAARPGTGPDAIGSAAPAPVIGDEARLRQVVANLVGNVIAHTKAGTSVRIGVGTVGTRAVLEIADNGPGLAPDQAARIFDRFYRADRSRSRTDGRTGSGLGLAIAQSLVAAHSGRIELRTAPGQGATFRIVLAAAGCQAERAADSPAIDSPASGEVADRS
ncbi:sensor histidine kinase [Actinopolymorpha pittospori]|uniref:histidine kinase n=1 Tax=Actinopolymorpha pittospori TaxID=648752 RepID=A0A927MTM9_9ACTN|nr:HAMP domain-containing sensor histidine kinase [Actinopolymorpha pittospori]MBE1605969.1 signal transduction histidine kinase [Actinopolymorpha pittospori]